MLALGLLLVACPSASGARGLGVGFVDDPIDKLLFSSDSVIRDKWLDRLEGTNANLVRLNLYWRSVVGDSEPAAPRDPADPAYDWTTIDTAVRAAGERGIEVVLTVLSPPDWAEGPGRPNDPDLRPGVWKPSGAKFEDFAAAVATRYSGVYPDPLGLGNLPRVRYYEAYNEPNLPNYLAPQWVGKTPKSPELYRDLLNGFYAGVHSVNPDNVVVGAGTSPFGDNPGTERMRPLYFWRHVLCLKDRKRLKKDKACASGGTKAMMDVFAHNTINGQGDGPTQAALHPDDATPADFSDLKKTVRAAERAGTVAPGGRRDLWSTEVWYETNPPDRRGSPPMRQAAYMQQALYVLWKQGASAAFFLQLRDSAYDPSSLSLIGFQTGVYFHSEKPKPSLRAVQFPFVADRKNENKVVLWGKAPQGGKLVVEEKKGGGFRTIARINVSAGGVFKKNVRLRGKHTLRAVVGAEKSLNWKLKS